SPSRTGRGRRAGDARRAGSFDAGYQIGSSAPSGHSLTAASIGADRGARVGPGRGARAPVFVQLPLRSGVVLDLAAKAGEVLARLLPGRREVAADLANVALVQAFGPADLDADALADVDLALVAPRPAAPAMRRMPEELAAMDVQREGKPPSAALQQDGDAQPAAPADSGAADQAIVQLHHETEVGARGRRGNRHHRWLPVGPPEAAGDL